MSREYVEKRINEALKLMGGNTTKARQQIIAWTYEDSKLLHGLAHPHLTGIVAHAISRVVNKHAEPDEVPATPEENDDPDHEFGMEILKTIASGATVRFGQENAAPAPRKQPASQRHIDAIRQMAGRKDPGDKA